VGTSIGFKRIARVDRTTVDRVRLRITDSGACPTISTIGVFHSP